MGNTLETLAANLPYGCSIYYFARIEGIPTLFSEVDSDAVAPSGYTLEPALIVDDSAKLGAVIDEKTHMGAAFDFTFQFADSPTIRTLFSRPQFLTQLTAPLTSGATSISVGGPGGDATWWPTTGIAYIRTEAIPYGSHTVDTLAGCTRGTYGLALSHPTGAVVASAPRMFVGRRVDLYAALMDCTGRFVQGSDILSDAAHLWSGHTIARPKRGNVTWDLQARSLDRRLAEPLGTEATGKAWFSLDDDRILSFNPASVLHVQIGMYYRDGSYNLELYEVEHVAFQPWIGMTSPASVSAQRLAVETAWAALTHASGVGTWKWQPYTDPRNFTGLMRQYEGYIEITSGVTSNRRFKIRTWTDGPSLLKHHAKDSEIQGVGLCATGCTLGAEVHGATLSVDLDSGDLSDLPSTGWIKIGTEDEVQLLHYDSLAQDPARGNRVQVNLAADSPVDLATLGAQELSPDGITSADVSFLWRATGTADNILLGFLESSGTGDRGSWDSWGKGAGYAIDQAQINEDSFAEVFDGLFRGLTLDIAIEGEVSIQKVFADLFRLSGRGVVVTPTVDGPKIKAVNLSAPDTAGYTISITEADLVWGPSGSNGGPIRPTNTPEAPGRIKVQPAEGAVRAKGATEPDPIIFRNKEAAEFGTATWECKVYGADTSALVGPTRAWADGYFLSAETRQLVEVDVSPWVAAYAGDVVHVDLADPTLWDYAAGATGYSGLARVWGAQTHPATGVRTLTLALAGTLLTRPLSPSAPVLGWSGLASAPDEVWIGLEYYEVFRRWFFDGGASFEAWTYIPGQDSTWDGFAVSAVTTDGLKTILATDGTYLAADLTIGHRVTSPDQNNCSDGQAAYCHSGDGTTWV